MFVLLERLFVKLFQKRFLGNFVPLAFHVKL